MKIELEPIGVIHSPHKKLEGMPIQPSRARGIKGTVEVEPRFEEGLQDLEGFSHIVLLYWLHKSEGYRLKVVPFLDDVERGLFATRAPRRPNPIGSTGKSATGSSAAGATGCCWSSPAAGCIGMPSISGSIRSCRTPRCPC